MLSRSRTLTEIRALDHGDHGTRIHVLGYADSSIRALRQLVDRAEPGSGRRRNGQTGHAEVTDPGSPFTSHSRTRIRD